MLCRQRIFTERFEGDVLVPWARRTARLDGIVYHLGLALGGRPAASFARRLMLPVSNDTLLRAVRRGRTPSIVPPMVIGIDDWAWRRNQRYGKRQDAVLDALKVDVQVKADRFSEAQRILSEQLVEQRADLRAIREPMQRIEVRLDQAQTPDGQ